jgi:bacterioferritin
MADIPVGGGVAMADDHGRGFDPLGRLLLRRNLNIARFLGSSEPILRIGPVAERILSSRVRLGAATLPLEPPSESPRSPEGRNRAGEPKDADSTMKGHPEVIEALNECLTAELTAINQYFIHHKMCANWGYERTAKEKREESINEMKDADRLIERILFLEGVPNMQRYNPVRVGETVGEMHKLDLELEYENVERLNRGVALAREKADNGTRELLEEILEGEEEAVDRLEAQLHLIGEVGVENYLAEMIKE